MRRLKRRIIRYSAAGVALAAAIGVGAPVCAGAVNVMAQDSGVAVTASATSMQIKKITFEKTDVTVGDVIVVTAEVTGDDNSYNSSLYIFLNSPSGDEKEIILDPIGNGSYRGVLNITDAWENAEYTVSDDIQIGGDIINSDSLVTDVLRISGSKTDNQPPIISNVKADKSIYSPGDVINITITAEDESEPIRFECNILGHYINVSKDSDEVYKGSITVDNSWENGQYNVEVNAIDALGNSSSSRDTTITISNSKEKAQISSVTFDKSEYHPGDTIEITVSAENERALSNLHYDCSDDGTVYFDYETWVKQADGSYKNKTKVTDWNLNGTYSINIDEYFSSVLSADTFTISGSKEDRQAPVINSIVFDKQNVVPGDVVNVRVNVTDDKSDIAGGHMSLSTNSEYIEYIELLPSNDGSLIGSITIDDSWANMKYEVAYVSVSDAAGNSSYSDSLSEGFTVSNSKADTNGPVIKGIYLDKTDVKPGDVVKITVEAEDPSGVDYIKIAFSPLGKSVKLRSDENGEISGNVYITENWDGGVYYAGIIDAVDNYGNGNYTEEYESPYITVRNSINDYYEPHYIISMESDDTESYPGEDLRITVKAVSTVGSIDGRLLDSDKEWVSESEFELQKIDPETYVGVLHIPEGIMPGEYEINLDKEIANAGPDSVEMEQDFDNPVIKVLSGVRPTQPSEEPTQPSEEPTQPSEEPTQPSEAPTKPSEEPTQPSEEPTQPSEEPSKPSEEPTKPSVEPTQPSETPTEPVVTPERQADYSKVNAAISKVPSEVDLSKYTDESVAALKAAIVAVVEGKKADEQGTVDGYADAIDKALAALELKSEETTEPTRSGQTGDTPASRNVPVSDSGTKDANTGSATDGTASRNVPVSDSGATVANAGSATDGTKTIAAGAQASGVSTGAAQAASQGAVQAGSQGAVQTTTPETGDKNHTPAWIAAIAAAGVALTAVVARRRKKQ